MRTKFKLTFYFGFDGKNIQVFRDRLLHFVESNISMHPGDTLKIDLVLEQNINVLVPVSKL